MQTALIKIIGESLQKEFEIVSFSMLEPSTSQFRFTTTQGQNLQSRGNVWSVLRGNLDSLPPFGLSGAALSLKPAIGLCLQ